MSTPAVTIAELLQGLDQMPPSEPSLAGELREIVKEGLRQALPPDGLWTESDPLIVSKYSLADALACETRFLIEDEFEWSEPLLRGRAAHRAIRFLVASPGMDPHDAAREGVNELAENDTAGVRAFIASMTEAARGDFTNMVAVPVEAFAEATHGLTIPKPVMPEFELRLRPCSGVRVTGRIDLKIGRPQRQADGLPLRSVLHLELKTGVERPQEHTEDARLYALLDTIRSGVAPGRSAIWYLASNEVWPVQIDRAALEAATRRLIEGTIKMAQLRSGAVAPTARAGWRCGRCPVKKDCAEGMARSLQRHET